MKLTRKQVAELLGVSTRTVADWQHEDGFPEPDKQGRANIYDGRGVIVWWYERELSRLVETDDGTLLDPAQERARLDQAKRVRTEIETKRLERELVDASAMRRHLAGASKAVRDAILAVPHRLAAVVAAETDADRVHALMVSELERALTALADGAPQLIKKAEAEVGQTKQPAEKAGDTVDRKRSKTNDRQNQQRQ